MLFGTGLFMVSSVGLTIPFLTQSDYWNRKDIVASFGYFSYHTRPFKMVSKPMCLVSHMFNHAGPQHWMGNVVHLVSSAHFLDLGFVPLTILFLGGGVCGVFGNLGEMYIRSPSSQPALDYASKVISWALNRRPEAISHSLHSLLYSDQVIHLCGASAGVFSLMGAEVVVMIHQVGHLLRPRKRASNTRRLREHALAELIVMAILRLGTLSGQVFQIIDPQPSKGPKIGYSAHVAGFAFGALMIHFFDYPVLDL